MWDPSQKALHRCSIECWGLRLTFKAECFLLTHLLQVSQHPQPTVWTLCRMTHLTGWSRCRRSLRWKRPAPQCPHWPPTVYPSVHSSQITELAGLPHPLAPSTHPHLVSRQHSDLQSKRPQTCYRVLPWTATKGSITTQSAHHKTINTITNTTFSCFSFHCFVFIFFWLVAIPSFLSAPQGEHAMVHSPKHPNLN